jgi:hypothetical protein
MFTYTIFVYLLLGPLMSSTFWKGTLKRRQTCHVLINDACVPLLLLRISLAFSTNDRNAPSTQRIHLTTRLLLEVVGDRVHEKPSSRQMVAYGLVHPIPYNKKL